MFLPGESRGQQGAWGAPGGILQSRPPPPSCLLPVLLALPNDSSGVTSSQPRSQDGLQRGFHWARAWGLPGISPASLPPRLCSIFLVGTSLCGPAWVQNGLTDETTPQEMATVTMTTSCHTQGLFRLFHLFPTLNYLFYPMRGLRCGSSSPLAPAKPEPLRPPK